MYLMMGVTLVLAFLCHTAHTDGEQLPGGAAANGAKGNTTTNKQPATCVQDPADWPAAAAILAAVQGKTGRKLNQNLQTQQQTQPQTQLSNAPVTVNGHSGATSDTQSPAGQQAYCIPTTPGDTFNVLCAGDSLTLGAVPSLCEKHPYSIKLTQLLQARLGDGAKAVTAGVLDAAWLLLATYKFAVGHLYLQDTPDSDLSLFGVVQIRAYSLDSSHSIRLPW
eukprot:GHRR01002621.1.p1 GENE.GHRR01002621.1~~GHRR01002621.1.p1  ORF type:complete len:222 (+),score=52.43 GHRR01002621.1:214-879(+)